jgi:hypothetical protein
MIHATRTLVALSFLILMSLPLSPPRAAEPAPPALTCLQQGLQKELSKLDSHLAHAARELSPIGLNGKEARVVLRRLCKLHDSIYDCITVDAGGKILAVEPGGYKKVEGKDISGQEQIVRLHKTKKPVLSYIFRAVEGIYAVDLEYPVFSSSGAFLGSVSILFRPESLIASVVINEIKGLPLDTWALQSDGRLLFALDPQEVGRNLIKDPLYKKFPNLEKTAMIMALNRRGRSGYTLIGDGQNSPSDVEVTWETVSLHGTEWRLAVAKVKSPDRKLSTRTHDELGVKSLEDALRTLAGEKKLKEAMTAGKNVDVYEMFKSFFADYGNIYAIQWVDEKGLNRFGYPDENSLINYDCTAPDSRIGGKIMGTLKKKKEASLDTPLVEGRKGHIFMVPVFSGDTYLGMIYTITITP